MMMMKNIQEFIGSKRTRAERKRERDIYVKYSPWRRIKRLFLISRFR